MHIFTKARFYLLVAVLLALGLLAACSSSATPVTPPIDKPADTPPTTTPPPENPVVTVNRVDIVYFYPKIRCGPCISVELRTKALLDTYFNDVMSSGKLTFQTYVLQEKQNAAIMKKYGAISSQLFINTIKNNTEKIKHVDQVWMPKLLNDHVAFEEFLRNLISQSLKEVM